jgi:hypothetical protein
MLDQPFDNVDKFPIKQTSDDLPGQQVGLGLFKYIDGVGYPASKDDIMDYATDQGAEEIIIEMLDQLPDTTYNTSTDVSQALAEDGGTH